MSAAARTANKRAAPGHRPFPPVALRPLAPPGAGAALRYSRRDAVLIAAAALHGAALAVAPPWPVIALLLWWEANTVSHNFIHNPFFRAPALNRCFSLYLSVVLGFPQSLWRDRHLAHHAGAVWRGRVSHQLVAEALAVAALWAAMLALHPQFLLTAYLPGWAAGLGLCYLQGYYEHARGTVNHYGALYNALFFNDGYHAEHHADPRRHWSRLPDGPKPRVWVSRWPAALRWLEVFNLESLERLTLRLPALQWFLLQTHERAFRRLLPRLGEVGRVAIVGGGIFPRTLIILRQLLPGARLVIIDAQAESIALARSHLREGQKAEGEKGNPALAQGPAVEFVNEWYDPARHNDFDLVIIPLSLVGDRGAIYDGPGARAVLVHDWIWRRRGATAIVSVLLLKRLNLVQR